MIYNTANESEASILRQNAVMLLKEKRSMPYDLEFFVKDTGLGIPQDKMHIVFDRFERAHLSIQKIIQGAGLGLAISKEDVEMLGGKIWVKNNEGKGSTFYFTIPYNSKPGEDLSVSSF